MIKQYFERLLWRSRFLVMAAVVTSLLISFAMFYIATVDAWYTLGYLFEYASPALSGEERTALRGSMVAHIVEIVDGYLLAAVLLIFALGLYELFINEIKTGDESSVSNNVLVIDSLDDLKTRLAKVILMILIVRFFEYAIGMHFENPVDLLYLSGGIALIGLALYLTHASEGHGLKG